MLVNGFKIEPYADLVGANFRGANLVGANLVGACLIGANFVGADLVGANFARANLVGANFRGANLTGVNFVEAKLPSFQITPVGYPLIGFKKLANGEVAVLEIPSEAKRTATLIGRKCRAEYVKVLSGEGFDMYTGKVWYEPGKIVKADKFVHDIRVQCTHGIHFFQTYTEAEKYLTTDSTRVTIEL